MDGNTPQLYPHSLLEHAAGTLRYCFGEGRKLRTRGIPHLQPNPDAIAFWLYTRPGEMHAVEPLYLVFESAHDRIDRNGGSAAGDT